MYMYMYMYLLKLMLSPLVAVCHEPYEIQSMSGKPILDCELELYTL